MPAISAAWVKAPASMLGALVVSLRPRQWVKNLFVFAGLVFGQRLFTSDVGPALATFVIFCGLSGALYLLNDVADREQDRRHPDKRQRPIAAGRLAPGLAVAVAVGLVAAGLAASLALSGRLALVALAWVSLLSAYSTWLKHVVIVDVLVVAAGFVLRAVGGAVVIDVQISGWLFICTTLLALFLALGKRRHEILTMAGEASPHRPVLADYSAGLLDQMIAVVTASTVTAYALYTMSPDTVARFRTPLLPVTLPLVLYGVFRYLYLLYRRQMGGNPSELFLHDGPLLVNALLWLLAVIAVIYGPRPPW